MTDVFLTIDTELSVSMFRAGTSIEANLARSIFGECEDGALGLHHQLARLGTHGLKAVFFVDPMPAAIFGIDLLHRIVAPILDAGHEVQLHIHTEWLPYMACSPVGERHGRDMSDFDQADQERLIAFATDLLTAAGAPPPTAFRAGNFGADDRTLRALAANGIQYDTSFNPGYAGAGSRISLPSDQLGICGHCGVVEVPVSAIEERKGKLRHAQLCALSSWEMEAALRHAVEQDQSSFTIVSHSFELLTRNRLRANRIIAERFERLCALLAELRSVAPTKGFGSQPRPQPGATQPIGVNILRTLHRMIEQALSTCVYERKWGPG